MNKRQENIEIKIHDIISGRKQLKHPGQVLLGLLTLYEKLGFNINNLINILKKRYDISNNEILLDLGIYLNFLTEEEIGLLEI